MPYLLIANQPVFKRRSAPPATAQSKPTVEPTPLNHLSIPCHNYDRALPKRKHPFTNVLIPQASRDTAYGVFPATLW